MLTVMDLFEIDQIQFAYALSITLFLFARFGITKNLSLNCFSQMKISAFLNHKRSLYLQRVIKDKVIPAENRISVYKNKFSDLN